MDDLQIKSDGNNYICDECKNENQIPEDKKTEEVIECQFCGIEYEIVSKNEDGNYILEMLEEEK